MDAVILIGIQGAGKSTFCRERFFATHARINLDMLKTRHREKRLLQTCLETEQPFVVVPGMSMVARLDGRSFTRLTKETHRFEAPFDIRFRDMMLATAEYLMTSCGFNIVFSYTQSDEISLLFGSRRFCADVGQ